LKPCIFIGLFFPDTSSYFLPFYNSGTEQLIQCPLKIYRAHTSFYKNLTYTWRLSCDPGCWI